MPSLRCLALPVIKSSLLEHTCCTLSSSSCCDAPSHSLNTAASCAARRACCHVWQQQQQQQQQLQQAAPAGSCVSVDCTVQLLWVPDRSAPRQSFSARRLQPTVAGVLHVPSASESLQPFATTAAQTVWGCTLLDGWPLSEAWCRLLCCIIDEAGLPHVCCPAPTSAACLHCTFSRRDSSFEEQLCCPWCANNCRQQLSLLWLGAGRGAALPFLAELWV